MAEERAVDRERAGANALGAAGAQNPSSVKSIQQFALPHAANPEGNSSEDGARTVDRREASGAHGMKTAGYVGLDVGGTGARAGVFDDVGKLLGFGRSDLTPTTPSEGRAEIDIDDIYEAARKSVAAAVRESGADIRALCVSSQGQTFVTLDADDRPLHPAFLWYDSRAAEQAEALRDTVISSGSSSPIPAIEAIATAPKIIWLRESHPDVMSRARRYLLLPEYLSYRLTGEAVTDPSTAQSTGLYADDAPGYSPESLAAAQIDETQIARIQLPGTPVATVRSDIADNWGLSSQTLVVTGTNDQYAGALGAGNSRPGIVSETTGTCLALVTLTETLPKSMPDGFLSGRFPISRYRFVLAYSKTAGVVLEWFNRQMCPDKTLAQLDSMAAEVPVGSRGITILPHFDGTVSPWPNPRARGFICNLSLNHTVADIFRALLESISFSLRENLEAMRTAGFEPECIRSIGGGAASDFWVQMKADVTKVRVERPLIAEAATLGAAMLAAVGAQRFSSIQESCDAFYRPGRIFSPNAANHALYESPYAAYRDLCARVYAQTSG